MKRLGAIALALLLLLALAACGGGEEKAFDPEDTARALLAGGAFSEPLEELEEAVYIPFYGLDRDGLTAGKAYGSTGATAEELAVLVFADEGAAQAGVRAMEGHLEYQRESNVDYRPAEMPKLDKAVLLRRGKTVLYVVAADYAAVEKALG